MSNKLLEQIRINALVGEYVNTKKGARLEFFILLKNILTLVVPIFFIALLLVVKTEYAPVGNLILIILSTALLVLEIFSSLIKIDAKKVQYAIAKNDHHLIAEEALKLLLQEVETENLTLFYTFITELEHKASDLTGEISNRLRQKAYREALKNLIPGSSAVTCPVCRTSPFKMREDLCQACGAKLHTDEEIEATAAFSSQA